MSNGLIVAVRPANDAGNRGLVMPAVFDAFQPAFRAGPGVAPWRILAALDGRTAGGSSRP
jgi:hypothetical protein